MLNLSESTAHFIASNYNAGVQQTVYRAFALLESFGVLFYEDKYTNLLTRQDSVDLDSQRDGVLMLLQQDLLEVIGQHGITLELEMEPRLLETVEITQFLSLVQNLEDYSDVTYRLYSNDSPKAILTDLIAKYTPLTKVRLLEIVASVQRSLVDTLKDYIEDQESEGEGEPVLNRDHLRYVQTFFAFIGEQDCLGRRFYEKGYKNVTLRELSDLLVFQLDEYFDRSIKTQFAQTVLDVFSLLVITCDHYTTPHEKFKSHAGVFSSLPENITRLDRMILQMAVDFTTYLNAAQDKELIDANAA